MRKQYYALICVVVMLLVRRKWIDRRKEVMKWLSLFLILSLIGCAVPPQFYEYKYKLVEPIESDTLHYEDENVNISFTIGLDDVSLSILNKLNKPITLLYERAVYVDQLNLAHNTIHSTLSWLTHETYSPPRVIPPKTMLHNYFAPVEKIENIRIWKAFTLVEPFSRTVLFTEELGLDAFERKKREKERRKVEERVLSELDGQAKANVGKIIGIFLPIEIDGRVENYFFKFEITNVNLKKISR